jgi:hypothetical protein
VGALLVGAVAAVGFPPAGAYGQEWEELTFSKPREVLNFAVSDGRKWAGYELVDRTARLINTETGTVVSLRPRRSCTNRYSDGGLVAIGGGQSMWQCRRSAYIRLYDVNRGRWHATRVPTGPPCEGERVPVEIGRSWLSEDCYGYHTHSVVYTKWRTGKSYVDQYGSPFPRSATSVADLNARTGQRHLCEPLRRSKNPNAFDYDVSPEYFGYLFDGRRGIDLGQTDEQLIVRACGGETVLNRPTGTHDVQLGGGLVSWYEPADNTVRVFRFSDGRGFSASTTLGDQTTGNRWVVHTRHAVYMSGYEEDSIGQPTGRKVTAVAAIPPPLP